jgi:anti-sigma B factor antagonist
MNIQPQGNTLAVSGVTELNAGNAGSFRDQVRAALAGAQSNIDIDLSQMEFVDSAGLGSLVALRKTASERNGRVRLINPSAHVQQILELTRLHRVFEIVRM